MGGATRRVVVVGGGPSGTLVALHLLRTAHRRGTRVEVTIVDPAPEQRRGRGPAFGTDDPDHLLNVTARRMSALPEDPDHFVAWCRDRGDVPDPGAYLSRASYGDYLRDALATAERATGARVRWESDRVVALRDTAPGLSAVTERGVDLVGDAVVLATGLPAPGVGWAPAALRASRAFVPDPWAPGALTPVRRCGARVLLVGTGLTMVDVALTATRRSPAADGPVEILAASRSGRLPARQASEPAWPVVPEVATWGPSLDELRDRVAQHLDRARRVAGDWRAGMDGLRPHIGALWRGLSEPDRQRFLQEDAGRWNRLRHRMPAATADAVDDLLDGGRLELTAARVVAAEQHGDQVRVRLSDGTDGLFGHVVNCTGPESDVRLLGDRLVTDLLRADRPGGALATVATAGLGFRADPDGRIVGAPPHGRTATAPLWAVGALRRGEEWESTAVPELSRQAAGAAGAMLAEFDLCSTRHPWSRVSAVRTGAAAPRGRPLPRRR